jgi:hypothetical protein
LLAELAAIEPARAAETALSLELDQDLIATAFALWAESDPDAALARAAAIPGPAGLRRTAALAILEVLGGDEAGLDRIVAALPVSDATPLWMGWLESRAAYDPRGAMRAALAQHDAVLQQDAIRAVATAWAAQDPLGALSAADSLGAQLADMFRESLVLEWARLDRASYAAWLQSLADPSYALLQGMLYLQVSDPEWVIDALGSIGGDAVLNILPAAIGTLAQTDPGAASALFDSMAPGRVRDRLARQIVLALGQTNPAAAVAWLDRIESPPPDAVMALANDMSTVDYGLMLELADRLPANDAMSSMTISIGTANAISRHPEKIPEYADLLLVRPDLMSREALGGVVAAWLDRDLDSALDWVQTHSNTLSSNVLSVAARRVANSDYLAATEFVGRIPEPQRAGWVLPTAAAYARDDAEGAALWAAQYRARDYYVRAMAEIILTADETGQAQADALLERHETNAEIRRQIRERMEQLRSSLTRG